MFPKRKRCALIFRKNQRRPKGEAVERVVVFDSKLNWKENINSGLKKVIENVLHEKAEIIWTQFRYARNFL